MSLQNKTILYLSYPCYICKDIPYTDGPKLILHLKNEHGIILPSRKRGFKRPTNDYFDYQLDFYQDWDEQHVACPSCWYHSKHLEPLEEHIDKNHLHDDKSLLNNLYDKRSIVQIYNIIDDIEIKFKNLLK